MNEMASGKKFCAVIHCTEFSIYSADEHAIRNVGVALQGGADGIFLIGHGMKPYTLCYIYKQVRLMFPEAWIGINFLLDVSKYQRLLFQVANECMGLDALWTDGQPSSRHELSSTTELFGGVAFKYINPNLRGPALATACEDAKRVVDVVTTSGSETGSPPEVSKLEEIRSYLGAEVPLALASGVSVDNVSQFLPVVDTFLVASSLHEPTKSEEGDYLSLQKVEELARLIHYY